MALAATLLEALAIAAEMAFESFASPIFSMISFSAEITLGSVAVLRMASICLI